MVQAAEAHVRAARLFDVIDFDAMFLAQRTIIRRAAFRCAFAAAFAAIFVAPFRGAARQRPPVVGPEGVGAFVAAPRTPALR